MQINQEEYDVHVAAIRSGKAVHLKGRLAVTIEQLHFIIDAEDVAPPMLPAPGVPHVLGFQDDSALDKIQKENDALRVDLAETQQRYEALKADYQTLSDQKTCLEVEFGTLSTLADDYRDSNTLLQAEIAQMREQLAAVPQADAPAEPVSPAEPQAPGQQPSEAPAAPQSVDAQAPEASAPAEPQTPAGDAVPATEPAADAQASSSASRKTR